MRLLHLPVFGMIGVGLYGLARLRRRFGPRPAPGPVRRVVHVSPSYFDDSSMIGGGERYAQSLAVAMADLADCTFVTFGRWRKTFYRRRLRFEVYPRLELINGSPFDPLCFSFLRELAGADVVHCHQYWTAVSNLAIMAGKACGKRVFVSDYGGAATSFTRFLDLPTLVDGFLPISACSAQVLPRHPAVRVIYGGVDERFLAEAPLSRREPKVVCVARVLPHKGTNYLIEGADPGTRLEIIGRVYDATFYALLERLAQGKQVRFLSRASDEDVLNAYRTASVAVLASVHQDVFGKKHSSPELLGLALLEAMACGTPVVCTNVGGMPEIVEDGVTGFVVPPNDPRALGERIRFLMTHPERAAEMGRAARQRVLERYTWEAVARACLAAYAEPAPETTRRDGGP